MQININHCTNVEMTGMRLMYKLVDSIALQFVRLNNFLAPTEKSLKIFIDVFMKEAH